MRNLWIIWYAILLHLIWGAILLLSPEPVNTTPIYTISLLIPSQHLMGLALLASGTCMIIACMHLAPHRPSLKALPFLLPQQFLLLLTTVGALTAAMTGTYADGVMRSPFFIFADQLPAILAGTLHTASIVRFFTHKWPV